MVSNIQRYDSNFHRYVLERPESNFEIDILLTSDWHFDNPKTDREMLFNHLDEVKKRNGYIIVNGDLLCLMMGKYDPRGSKSGIRPEHNGDNYLDLVINDTAEKLIPYAHNILQINKGNHETAVSKRSETDVLERLVERINAKAGSNIQLGAYTGFITLCLMRSGGTKHSCKIGYSHGNWGGVVTKGALSVQRYASFLDGADIIMSGHTHDRFVIEFNKLSANSTKGIVENKTQYHVKTGTYKEEFVKGEGWATEKIGMPKSLGSVWCKIIYSRNEGLQFEFTPTRHKY
ncbi:hypothetical protein CMU70_14290 [Elizabethkingia anophelis]|nr:hypothetical protein [Elizabethkingia anophelis]